MAQRRLSPPAAASDAARILGQQIHIARLERRLTSKELAARSGISPHTLIKIERGDPAVSIGNVFTVATHVGLSLFGADTPQELSMLRRIGADKLALMPTRVSPRKLGEDGLDF